MSDYFEASSFDESNYPRGVKSSLEFVECHFKNIDFKEENFSRLKFIDCIFTECDLSNARLKGGQMRSPRFARSKLMGLNWVELTTFANPHFEDSILDYSVFQGLSLKGAQFIKCKIHEADLSRASFVDTSLKNTIFSGANLMAADFRGATEYSINVKEVNLSKARFSIPEAVSLISSLNIVIED